MTTARVEKNLQFLCGETCIPIIKELLESSMTIDIDHDHCFFFGRDNNLSSRYLMYHNTTQVI